MDKKILIVDDAMFMRNIIRKILKEDGYTQVWEAQDGEHAMELFREISPDLVLLDITMPGRHHVLSRGTGDDDSESPDRRCSGLYCEAL